MSISIAMLPTKHLGKFFFSTIPFFPVNQRHTDSTESTLMLHELICEVIHITYLNDYYIQSLVHRAQVHVCGVFTHNLFVQVSLKDDFMTGRIPGLQF